MLMAQRKSAGWRRGEMAKVQSLVLASPLACTHRYCVRPEVHGSCVRCQSRTSEPNSSDLRTLT